ncbi:MAG: hypothetical protein BRC30_01270, partial [Nanohaloarchaea archaeon SW_7_46_7]
DTPTQKIRSMSMGTVEVKGEAGVVSEKLKSPLTNTECVYYEYEVEEYKRTGKHKSWQTIDTGSSSKAIGIDDGTGAAVVEVDRADVELPDKDYKEKISGGEEPPQRIQEFIEETKDVEGGHDGVMSIFDNSRRYTEWYIEPGDHLYIFGYAEEERRSDGTNYPVITSGNAPMFYVTDKSEEYLRDLWGWTYKAMLLAGIILIPLGYFMMAGMMGLI